MLTAWDIGGANLKAVSISQSGEMLSLVEPLPLWQNKELLAESLTQINGRLPKAKSHFITMSGEGADCFSNRSEGVVFIAAAAKRALGECRFYGFGGICEDVSTDPLQFASANWHLVATALRQAGERRGVWLDIGSTTTDIIPLDVPPPPDDDYDRLQKGSLVYRGVVRTPLMGISIARHTAAEYFADMGDVYDVLGIEVEVGSGCVGADGKPRASFENAATRLLRMIGKDYAPSNKPLALELAAEFQQSFESELTKAFPHSGPVITSGIGDFISITWARSNGLSQKSVIESLFGGEGKSVASQALNRNAAALALAWLAKSRAS